MNAPRRSANRTGREIGGAFTVHIASNNTTNAAYVPQLQQNVYLSHSGTAWKYLVRGAPAAGVLAAADPKALNVV